MKSEEPGRTRDRSLSKGQFMALFVPVAISLMVFFVVFNPNLASHNVLTRAIGIAPAKPKAPHATTTTVASTTTTTTDPHQRAPPRPHLHRRVLRWLGKTSP